MSVTFRELEHRSYPPFQHLKIGRYHTSCRFKWWGAAWDNGSVWRTFFLFIKSPIVQNNNTLLYWALCDSLTEHKEAFRQMHSYIGTGTNFKKRTKIDLRAYSSPQFLSSSLGMTSSSVIRLLFFSMIYLSSGWWFRRLWFFRARNCGRCWAPAGTCGGSARSALGGGRRFWSARNIPS